MNQRASAGDTPHARRGRSLRAVALLAALCAGLAVAPARAESLRGDILPAEIVHEEENDVRPRLGKEAHRTENKH